VSMALAQRRSFREEHGMRRKNIQAITSLLATAILAASVSACAGAATPASTPAALRLMALSSSVTDYSYPGFGTILNLPLYMTPVGAPFEIRLHRTSYDKSIVATRIIKHGRIPQVVALPPTLGTNFFGLPGFLHIVVTSSTGKRMFDANLNFCPTGATILARDAAATSPYPRNCSVNPFSLGSVWGIPVGWGARITGNIVAPLAVGETYSVKAQVTEPYQKLLGISSQPMMVRVIVRHGSGVPSQSVATSPGASSNPPIDLARLDLLQPTGEARVAPRSIRPDLRALPPWGIEIAESRTPGGAPEDLLRFNATVWNAGKTPLIIAGFRQRGNAVMRAYQYFLNQDGTRAGYAPIGTLYYDSDSGHSHWHYADLASYRLLSADRKTILISQKTGFCLADTDSIDYLIENAVWRPSITSLAAACGHDSPNPRSVAMFLSVGNGDTYEQRVAGQSFDVTKLPNGVYYIQILVNPGNRIYDSGGVSVALRKISLSGSIGHRTVEAQAVGMINTN
jgi:hypothetical protein